MEAFSGICGSRLPQYFTKAILLGVFQVTLPLANLLLKFEAIKSVSIKFFKF